MQCDLRLSVHVVIKSVGALPPRDSNFKVRCHHFHKAFLSFNDLEGILGGKTLTNRQDPSWNYSLVPNNKNAHKGMFPHSTTMQEGGCQKCCITLCRKVFTNHFYQMKESPGCLNILKYWVDRLREPQEEKFKQEYFINRHINFATIFYIKLPTSTAALLVVNSMKH